MLPLPGAPEGTVELALGTPVWERENRGVVVLLSLHGTTSEPAAELAHATVRGGAGDRLGVRLAGTGDVDGDGRDDLAVLGEADLWGLSSRTEGEATIDDVTLWSLDWPAPTHSDGLLPSLLWEDIDQDGVEDMVATSANPEFLVAFLGPLRVDMELEDADLRLQLANGTSSRPLPLALVQDATGSGYPGLAVATPESPRASDDLHGQVQVYSGPLVELDSADDAVASLTGPRPDTVLGAGLAVADLDDDGWDDLAVTGESGDEEPTTGLRVWRFAGPFEGGLDFDDATVDVAAGAIGELEGLGVWRGPDETLLWLGLGPAPATDASPAVPGRVLLLP